MKVPMKWLKEYVDIDVSPKKFSDEMTMSGSKVEGVETLGEGITNVLLGRIVSLAKHPDADKLQIGMVDIGSETLQIVTGADNIAVGDLIPVACHGATLPNDVKIKKGKLRGVESSGMMCSIQELGYTRYDFPDACEHGIYIIPQALIDEKYDGKAPLGTDALEVLGIRDAVVEFEITPNRPDCLSMVGIAREVAATFSDGDSKVLKLKRPATNVSCTSAKAADAAKVTIEAPDLCPRYAARVINNVKIKPSPFWMQERLRTAGIRPINNIVDITNYVMLEMGQPMHAFDLDELAGSSIIVRRAKPGETITTLDGQQRPLDENMLVIADAEKAVAVAGVMGGANSEVTEKTTRILFESATFNGTSVRLAGKKIGLRTEASMRFEKGLDINGVIDAVDRAAYLIQITGAGEVADGIIDCYPVKVAPRVIPFQPDRINALLGTDISAQKMADILNSVEIVTDVAKGTCTVPTFREEIELMADLAEEVARFYGYNNIKPTLLAGKQTTIGRKSAKQMTEDAIRNSLFASGLSEIYTYSFTSNKVFDQLLLPEGDVLRNAVRISNPLGEDQSIMRTTTMPDMMTVLARNYNRRLPEARLFELSFTYRPGMKTTSQVEGINEKALPLEVETLTLGMYGGSADFYELKGAVEEMLEQLNINDYEFVKVTDNPSMHPGRTAALYIGGKQAGFIGEVHPKVMDNFEIAARTYIGIIEVDALLNSASNEIKYKPLPKYPAVTRDIAMLVADAVMVGDIEAVIKKYSGKLLEDVKLFDVYKGKQVPEGFKSVAYAITFRAEDRTLTDDEVNAVFSKIVKGLKQDLDAQLREA